MLLVAAPGPSRADEGARAPPGAEGLGVAYRALKDGDYERAYSVAVALDASALENADYAHYAAGQAAYLTGRYSDALARFRTLATESGSRFLAPARWRYADSLWQLGQIQDAKARYERLLRRHPDEGDQGVARFRIAEAYRLAGEREDAKEAYRRVRVEHPQHPLEPRATKRLFQLGGEPATRLSPADRLRRTVVLGDDHRWDDAHREVWSLGRLEDEAAEANRHYWTAMTLYNQRRQYGRAGEILLQHYDAMGGRSARALFHGARALSRADRDAEAVEHYLRVVDEFPRSGWASQAQFLAGWLRYNMGEFEAAIPLLEEVESRYPRSQWARSARWFRGFSHYLAGDYDEALDPFEEIAEESGAMHAGKGHYWQARTLQKLGRDDEAVADYRELAGRYPLSWYALLAHARLREQDIEIHPLGDDPRPPSDAPSITTRPSAEMASDRLIRRADELIAAGLDVEAGIELRRGERGFIRRHGRAAGVGALVERYRTASNYHRPWSLAVTYGGRRALSAEPSGRARIWWEHAYPLAYNDLVEPWRDERDLPDYFVHAIMRQESGFDPNALSFADARGLIQIIPRTTRRIAEELGMTYTEDMLWDPDTNLRIGTWYLARLLDTFRGQIAFAAGAYNSGPGPVIRWLDRNGDHPVDEFVERVSFAQTRNYMKVVTAIYARYVYLYDGEVYELPLDVNASYRKDGPTF